MVARGEIGLLIVEIGLNETPYVSEAGFHTAVWAIILCTIIGPVMVGLLVKYKGQEIGEGKWGIQPMSQSQSGGSDSSTTADGMKEPV